MRLSSHLARQAVWMLAAAAWIVLAFYNQQQFDARTPVLVATHDLVAGTALAEGDFTTGFLSPIDYRDDMLPADAAGSLVGVVVIRDIFANEPLTRTRLASADGRFSSRFADLIGDSRARVVAWPARDVALTPTLRGGDLVDLTVVVEDKGTGSTIAKTIVQRVRVVSVGKSEVLLLVPAELVEPLLFARTQGLVEFALAGPNADKVDTSGIDFEQFKQRFIVPAASPTPAPSGTPGASATPRPSVSPSPAPSPTSAIPAPSAEPVRP